MENKLKKIYSAINKYNKSSTKIDINNILLTKSEGKYYERDFHTYFEVDDGEYFDN